MDERFEKYFLSLLSDEEKQQLFEDLEKDAVLKKEFAKAQNFVSFLEMLIFIRQRVLRFSKGKELNSLQRKSHYNFRNTQLLCCCLLAFGH